MFFTLARVDAVSGGMNNAISPTPAIARANTEPASEARRLHAELGAPRGAIAQQHGPAAAR